MVSPAMVKLAVAAFVGGSTALYMPNLDGDAMPYPVGLPVDNLGPIGIVCNPDPANTDSPMAPCPTETESADCEDDIVTPTGKFAWQNQPSFRQTMYEQRDHFDSTTTVAESTSAVAKPTTTVAPTMTSEPAILPRRLVMRPHPRFPVPLDYHTIDRHEPSPLTMATTSIDPTTTEAARVTDVFFDPRPFLPFKPRFGQGRRLKLTTTTTTTTMTIAEPTTTTTTLTVEPTTTGPHAIKVHFTRRPIPIPDHFPAEYPEHGHAPGTMPTTPLPPPVDIDDLISIPIPIPEIDVESGRHDKAEPKTTTTTAAEPTTSLVKRVEVLPPPVTGPAPEAPALRAAGQSVEQCTEQCVYALYQHGEQIADLQRLYLPSCQKLCSGPDADGNAAPAGWHLKILHFVRAKTAAAATAAATAVGAGQ